MNDGTPLLQVHNISKNYGGVRALENAQLQVNAGRIHAVLGENGAGKSTLIKIISGVVQPDSGSIYLDGVKTRFITPKMANDSGVVCIFQELSLIPDLSVADNIALGGIPKRFGLIDYKAQRRFAEIALAEAGAQDIHPLALVRDLPLSRRQMVEIAKALARKPRLLILDEATSALTSGDVMKVFSVLKQLRNKGLCLLYISHRMQEIDELADDCSVFRNGRYVASYIQGSKSRNEVIEMMIGRECSQAFPVKSGARKTDTPSLEVSNLNWTERLQNISFKAHPGEILGLGGLDGQGQRELLLALFGVLRGVTGEITVGGAVRSLKDPRVAKSDAIALIPEDRKTEGLLLSMSVKDNLSLPALEMLATFGVIKRRHEKNAIDRMVKLLSIKAASLDIFVGALSGGNQQKVVIAKWLMTEPKIILLNDPTRGIDVGTKQEIYQLLRNLADAGSTILFYSTDYDELIGCCDQVLVMYDGSIVSRLIGTEITEHALVSSAFSINTEKQKE